MRTPLLFRSNDLACWEYLHPFTEGDVFGLPGDDFGCPYFWPLGDRHILLHFSHLSGAHYLSADGKHVLCVWGNDTWRVRVAYGEVELIPFPRHCWHSHSSRDGRLIVGDSNNGFFRIARAGARTILIDDDFRLGERSGSVGCFCERHLEAFRARTGLQATREEVAQKAFTGPPSRFRDDWLEVTGGSLPCCASVLTQFDLPDVYRELAVEELQLTSGGIPGCLLSSYTGTFHLGSSGQALTYSFAK